MSLQNRVTPFGEIVADPARGTMLGNRGGCFHDSERRLKKRHWVTACWITCVLDFKERQRTVMTPGSYTELFFLDEATALAAGHRPCAECRREDFNRYAILWNDLRGQPGRAYIRDMDPVLHHQRCASAPSAVSPAVNPGDQPDGTFVTVEEAAHLIWQGKLWRWSFGGYVDGGVVSNVPSARLITPPASCDILAAGYLPGVHPTANR